MSQPPQGREPEGRGGTKPLREGNFGIPQKSGFSRGEVGASNKELPEVPRGIVRRLRMAFEGFGGPEPSPQVNSTPSLAKMASPPGREKTPLGVCDAGDPEDDPAQPPNPPRDGDGTLGGRPKGVFYSAENPLENPLNGSPRAPGKNGRQRLGLGLTSARENASGVFGEQSDFGASKVSEVLQSGFDEHGNDRGGILLTTDNKLDESVMPRPIYYIKSQPSSIEGRVLQPEKVSTFLPSL